MHPEGSVGVLTSFMYHLPAIAEAHQAVVLLNWAVYLSLSVIGQQLGYARLLELQDQLLLDVNLLAAVIIVLS